MRPLTALLDCQLEVFWSCIDKPCDCSKTAFLYQLLLDILDIQKTSCCERSRVRGELDVPLLIRIPDESKQAANQGLTTTVAAAECWKP